LKIFTKINLISGTKNDVDHFFWFLQNCYIRL